MTLFVPCPPPSRPLHWLHQADIQLLVDNTPSHSHCKRNSLGKRTVRKMSSVPRLVLQCVTPSYPLKCHILAAGNPFTQAMAVGMNLQTLNLGKGPRFIGQMRRARRISILKSSQVHYAWQLALLLLFAFIDQHRCILPVLSFRTRLRSPFAHRLQFPVQTISLEKYDPRRVCCANLSKAVLGIHRRIP